MKRVQKILAEAGVASRRKCEDLIVAGKVKVNGKIVSLGAVADESMDKIIVNNKPINIEKKIYILLNKPKGYVTTVSEEHGMDIVLDLINISERVFPVGRLDKDTEGVLLLTNDGDLANRLLHPSFGVEKEYVAWLDLPFIQKTKLEKGIRVEEHTVRVKGVHVQGYKVKLRIHEGRKHIVRKLFAMLGYKVIRLVRTEFAGLKAGSLKEGKWRFLSAKELKSLSNKAKSSMCGCSGGTTILGRSVRLPCFGRIRTI